MLTNRPDSAALRIHMRSEHEDDLTQVADRIAFAGPRLGDDAQTKLGNLTAISLYATCFVSPNPLLRSRASSRSGSQVRANPTVRAKFSSPNKSSMHMNDNPQVASLLPPRATRCPFVALGAAQPL